MRLSEKVDAQGTNDLQNSVKPRLCARTQRLGRRNVPKLCQART